jgi:glucokinase
MSQTLLGIDIGGTKIEGGLVDAESGSVLLQERTPTLASEGGAAILNCAIILAQQMIGAAEKIGAPIPSAVGIGAGGQIDARTGIVLSATELLPGWAGTQLKDAFEEALQIPAAADNDVNALAMGESRFGAGRNLDNLVYLAIGTGLGGAFLSGGKLHQSHFGVSGELGHLILFPDGLPCTCGGYGCWEQYVSGPALLRYFHDFGGDISIQEGEPLGQMAQQDRSGPAARAIRAVAESLGIGLISVVNIFGPDRVVLGGGMMALNNLILEPARKIVQERAMPAVRNVPILPAELGAHASIVGAATLAHSFLTDNRPS